MIKISGKNRNKKLPDIFDQISDQTIKDAFYKFFLEVEESLCSKHDDISALEDRSKYFENKASSLENKIRDLEYKLSLKK